MTTRILEQRLRPGVPVRPLIGSKMPIHGHMTRKKFKLMVETEDRIGSERRHTTFYWRGIDVCPLTNNEAQALVMRFDDAANAARLVSNEPHKFVAPANLITVRLIPA